FETAGVYNVSRYVGLKADVSGTYNSTSFSVPVTAGTTTQTVSFDTKNSLYNFLGGVQVKDNANEGRFKPFAHGLVGVGYARTSLNHVVCSSNPSINCGVFGTGTQSDTGFAAVIGGGIDIRVNDKVDFRALQVDYNPMRFNGNTDHNIRLGIGIVIK